jgi:class 3 adenylate cyclase
MAVVRALLLTDVVDSTRLSAALGDAATARLWAAHDRVARDLLRDAGGREIDKSDGMLLLFESAADAVRYAFAYHSALTALETPIKARAALHVGPVLLRENSAADVALGAKPLEVDGIAKVVAARMMATARGGQTLLSSEAGAALGDTSLASRSHGYWRLKGIPEPMEVLEVQRADGQFAEPLEGANAHRVTRAGDLWLPVREIARRLPGERDAFVGRHEQLADLTARFAGGARLVSLLGMGGSGKTRLALRFAWANLADFPGGVWFCDLAPARSLDGIVRAVADALDVPLGKDDPVAQLGSAIAGRGTCLVIMDNFEQVSRHSYDTLGAWLDRAPAARFLVTTREVLGLPGEQTIALPPLAPRDAAALFTLRAQAARENFQPGADDDAAIAELSRLLDGLPLAIELAAARVRAMAPRALLARVSERFKLLASAGGRRDRQATLRATLDWSWDLRSSKAASGSVPRRPCSTCALAVRPPGPRTPSARS